MNFLGFLNTVVHIYSSFHPQLLLLECEAGQFLLNIQETTNFGVRQQFRPIRISSAVLVELEFHFCMPYYHFG